MANFLNLKLGQDFEALVSDQAAKLDITPEEFVSIAINMAALASDHYLTVFNSQLKVVDRKTLTRDYDKQGTIPFTDEDVPY